MRRPPKRVAHCPDCGYPFEEAASLTGGRRPPREGDLALCINCGAIHRYDADGGVRRPTDSETFAWIVGDTEQWGAVEQAQAMIRRRGLIRPRVAAEGSQT